MPNVTINTDLASLKAAVERLKEDPSQLQAFEQDPGSFLGKLGIQLDDQTLGSIRSQLSARRETAGTRAVQAGTVHIDIFN